MNGLKPSNAIAGKVIYQDDAPCKALVGYA
jgi:hypothetical protein